MLSDAFLNRLDTLALHIRRQSGAAGGGLRRSKALGSSVEFSDFREYAPGDDIRRIDWNAYARFERLFLKLFLEEREVQVNLIVDASASMGFGSPSKLRCASLLAQAIGYLALRGGDCVTAFTLGTEVRRTRALRGRHCYAELAAFLDGAIAQGQARLNQSVPSLPLPNGGMTVFVGDVLCEDGYDRAFHSLIYRRQELSVCQVLSPHEWEPSLETIAELEDSETGDTFVVAAGYDVLRRYREAAQSYVASLRAFLHARGAAHVLLLTEDDFEKALLRALSRSGLVA